MEIKQIPISEIKEYSGNRRNNKKTVPVLAGLIEKVGFNVPLVIDKNGVIVKGHARYKAAKQLGMVELPCIISENSDEVNDEDRILDNQISSLSKWDTNKLGYEIDEIGESLKELGINIRIGKSITEITPTDIEKAENEQVIDEKSRHEVNAMMSFTCPECGGFFEHKIS